MTNTEALIWNVFIVCVAVGASIHDHNPLWMFLLLLLATKKTD